ncbi:MAG TPA: hypothetical protein VKU80_19035 [Planctomycetota bacterium]|nr:hypothetical protein [Planctomycetota bacterium]
MKHLLSPLLLLSSALASPPREPDDLPRIESVVPAARQPHAADPAVIWYDSFDGPDSTQDAYFDLAPANAKRSDQQALGGAGRSMELFYGKGKQGTGNRKILFGDSPFGKPLRKGEKFTEIYWRHYVKHQKGWTGDPAKMSRATGFVSDSWNQAFILHVWGSGTTLTLDPARGVRDGKVVTTKYNDFPNLKWLGNSPSGKFPVHSSEEAGRWICIEAHLKLNTPGKADGLAELWVDGVLDAERRGMDYRGSYDAHTINAVFLEAYWNDGSPVDQYRWYDDFVVSTKPIGPIVAPAKPTLILASSAPCEVKVADDRTGTRVRWSTKSATGKATVTTALESGPTYYCRVRHPGGEWSPWHQPFLVEK